MDLTIFAAASTVITASTLWLGIFKYQEGKQKKIYEKLEEHKRLNDATFVRQDLCGERHQRLQADISEIKQDVKSLLKRSYQGGAHA